MKQENLMNRQLTIVVLLLVFCSLLGLVLLDLIDLLLAFGTVCP